MSTRFTFFSGKGGAGKTTMACATAVPSNTRAATTLTPHENHRTIEEPC